MILRDYVLGTPATLGCLLLKGAAVAEAPRRIGGGFDHLRRPEDVFPRRKKPPTPKRLSDVEVLAILAALGHV